MVLLKKVHLLMANDILISKYIKNEDETFDDSVGLKADVDGVVDKVFIDYMNTHKHRICKVRISNKRNPALGDKFAIDTVKKVQSVWCYVKKTCLSLRMVYVRI